MGGRKGNKRAFVRPDTRLTKARLLMVAVALIIVASCLMFTWSLKRQLYEQRSYSLSQTMEKIVQLMNNTIDNEWDRLTYAAHELARAPQADRAQLLERLADFHQIDARLQEWKLSCIDVNGNLYRWDGSVGRWTLPEMLLEHHSNYQIAMVEAHDSDGERLEFVYCLPRPIHLTDEDVTLTHAVLSLDMEAFGEALEVSAFDGTSYSYITGHNGTRLYHQKNQAEFISAYNIMTALQNCAFLYGQSYEDLARTVEAGTPYTAEIEREGQRYFVAYAPLSVNNWRLFLFVPEANVGGNTTHLVSLLLMEVGVIALLLILMVCAFVWSNARQTLARQQAAVDEARRASQAKSDFLSHMSHDMRTPLNGIMGMCHIARKRLGDEGAVAQCLEKIDLSSRQLMALINDVLDMSRIERGKVEIDPVPMDIHQMIRACTVHIEVRLYENNIAFEQDVGGLVHPQVYGDPVLLEKILTNILGNAAKFTRAGGSIWLRASEEQTGPGQSLYRFEIQDTGVGMKPEFLEHLFEPFSQEDGSSRTQYQGTGLGLSIVKNLVDQMGGKITVQSAVGEGSTFTVVLPLPFLEEAEPPVEEERSQRPFDGTGRRVLLVEDNELNREIAQALLEECGLSVDSAEDGSIAVERFKAAPLNAYDVILMDVRMPVMDGLEASRRIRALPRADAASVPIIALTADAMATDVERTRAAGMNAHLGKPIDVDKLYEVLGQYCRGGAKL